MSRLLKVFAEDRFPFVSRGGKILLLNIRVSFQGRGLHPDVPVSSVPPVIVKQKEQLCYLLLTLEHLGWRRPGQIAIRVLDSSKQEDASQTEPATVMRVEADGKYLGRQCSASEGTVLFQSVFIQVFLAVEPSRFPTRLTYTHELFSHFNCTTTGFV